MRVPLAVLVILMLAVPPRAQASGAKQEGSRMAKEAGSALDELERRQCSGCTIDASGFR
jgi:hypothetical protein